MPGHRVSAHPPQPAVDPRLLQANERTLLAWVRTGIALMTFGFVIARIGVWLRAVEGTAAAGEPQRTETAWIGAAFVAAGVIGNALAIRRYAANRRAIRAGTDILDDRFPIAFGALVTALGAVMGAYVLSRLL
jgi:putative membrane protein